LQAKFEELVKGVEDGDVLRSDAAVMGQLLNGARACVRDTLAALEQEQLIERLEALEAGLAARKRGSGMGLRQAIRRAEKAAEGQVESFRTRDGRRYVYDPEEVGKQLFVYACATIRDPYTDEPPPEEPEFLEAVRNAVDPDEVIGRFASGNPSKAFVNIPAMVYGEE